MAHNSRLRAPGFWTLASVVDPAEFEAFDQSRYESITELGGTWTMAAQGIFGGAGFKFNCSVEGAWVPATQITVAGAGMKFISGGPLQIATGTTLTVMSGGHLVMATGADATWQTGATETHASGSTTAFANGATVTFGTSTVTVAGLFQFASGAGFSLENGSSASVQATASLHTYGSQIVHSGGDINFDSGSTLSCDAGSTITGSIAITGNVTRTGSETLVGPGATRSIRPTSLSGLGAGNVTINHGDQDVCIVPGTLGGTRFLTLKTSATGSNPPTNSVTRYKRSGAPDANLLHIQDDVGNPIVDLLASKRAFVDIRWNGTAYECDAFSADGTAVTVY